MKYLCPVYSTSTANCPMAMILAPLRVSPMVTQAPLMMAAGPRGPCMTQLTRRAGGGPGGVAGGVAAAGFVVGVSVLPGAAEARMVVVGAVGRDVAIGGLAADGSGLRTAGTRFGRGL